MALQQEKVVLLVGGNNFYKIFISSVKYNFGGIISSLLVIILRRERERKKVNIYRKILLYFRDISLTAFSPRLITQNDILSSRLAPCVATQILEFPKVTTSCVLNQTFSMRQNPAGMRIYSKFLICDCGLLSWKKWFPKRIINSPRPASPL